MKINEENFIGQLRRKNERAMDYVIDTYGCIIKSVVKKHLYNLTSVQEECINDVLLAIWNNIDSFNEERSSFKNWIIGISKFKSIDYKRKYLIDLENSNIDDMYIADNDFTEEILQNELSIEMTELMNCLNKKDREIFHKLYVEERDMNEVSEDTGIKREIIYNRISRAKKRLRNIFRLNENGGIKYEK